MGIFHFCKPRDRATGAYSPFQWPQVPGGTVNIHVFPSQGQGGGVSPGP